MKKIFTYTLLVSAFAAIALSCAKQDETLTTGNKLEVQAELASSPMWTSRGASERIVYGGSAEIEGGEYIITAQKEEWSVDTAAVEDVPLTRGTPITSVSGIANMCVNVYMTNGTNWTTSSTRTATVNATNVGGSFTSTPSYPWFSHATNKTTLFAYSPIPTGTNGLTDNGYQVTYAVPTTVGNQPDFCTATPDKDVVNSDGSQHVRNVALEHRLTAVGFSMLGWNLKITNITVSGVSAQGVFNMNTSSWGSLGSSTESRSVGVSQSTFPGHSHNSSYTDITSSNGYLMMIPQTLTDAAMVTITYTANASSTAEGGTLTAKLKDLGVTWEAGDKITYNIRLKTAPAVTSGNLTINNGLKGYTTTTPMTMSMDSRDKLTFTWSADWLKIHQGGVKNGDVSGGYQSPWSVGPGGPWSNIYFFATTDNASTVADRSATVTVTGTRSGKKTFNVTQIKSSLAILDYTKEPSNVYAVYGDFKAVKFNALKKPIAKYKKGNSTPTNTTGYNPLTASGDNTLANSISYTSGDKIEVTWQTAVNHGTTGGASNMVIESISLGTDGIATVNVRGTGNALLSYKRGTTILWSYHIWVTDTNPFVNHHNTGSNVNGSTASGVQAKFMDRNLGALSARSTQPTIAEAYKYFGMLYQHGRPTPFTGQGLGTAMNTYTKIYNGSGTEITSSIGGYTQSSTAVSTVTDAIKNPSNYYYQSFNGGWSWFNVDISLWSDYSANSKSIYDPCPYGYRVPIHGSWNGLTISHTGGSAALTLGSTWNGAWCPMGGNRGSNSGTISNVGSNTFYWLSTQYTTTYRSYVVVFTYSGSVNYSGFSHSSGYSVRCVQEGY